MELLFVLFVGILAGSTVTYDSVSNRADRLHDHLIMCRMELSEAKADLRECNEAK